jgi:hypothetical protein
MHSLVYTEAVLIETLRLANVAPLALMHCASKDTQLRGFDIPKVRIVNPSVLFQYNNSTSKNTNSISFFFIVDDMNHALHRQVCC